MQHFFSFSVYKIPTDLISVNKNTSQRNISKQVVMLGRYVKQETGIEVILCENGNTFLEKKIVLTEKLPFI